MMDFDVVGISLPLGGHFGEKCFLVAGRVRSGWVGRG